MQIKCFKNPAQLFDELSILSVKIDKCQEKGIRYDYNSMNQLENEIIGGIGQCLFLEILESQEYDDLYKLNTKIFELIDLLRAAKIQNNNSILALSNDRLRNTN
jgi:hypothetical protein